MYKQKRLETMEEKKSFSEEQWRLLWEITPEFKKNGKYENWKKMMKEEMEVRS